MKKCNSFNYLFHNNTVMMSVQTTDFFLLLGYGFFSFYKDIWAFQVIQW